jgi:hypothetical protein
MYGDLMEIGDPPQGFREVFGVKPELGEKVET